MVMLLEVFGILMMAAVVGRDWVEKRIWKMRKAREKRKDVILFNFSPWESIEREREREREGRKGGFCLFFSFFSFSFLTLFLVFLPFYFQAFVLLIALNQLNLNAPFL